MVNRVLRPTASGNHVSLTNVQPRMSAAQLNGRAMNKSELREYHKHALARLRALAENATTPRVKALLLEEAEEHERLIEELDDLKAPAD